MQKSAQGSIVYLTGAFGALLVFGGIYLASADKIASIKFTLLGNDFSSNSIGVALAFMGAFVVVTVFIFALKSSGHSGGAGGNAEVEGDGEAHGGHGGPSGRFGPGGDGGHANAKGAGKAKGGTGGDGG